MRPGGGETTHQQHQISKKKRLRCTAMLGIRAALIFQKKRGTKIGFQLLSY